MSKRPNILWYCTDQQRFDTIGALGNAHINTPRLDEFMRQSATFTHAYCQSPICTPSRASFMTGMYPSAVSVTGNGNSVFPKYYEDRLITHALAQDGYDCGLIGNFISRVPLRHKNSVWMMDTATSSIATITGSRTRLDMNMQIGNAHKALILKH